MSDFDQFNRFDSDPVYDEINRKLLEREQQEKKEKEFDRLRSNSLKDDLDRQKDPTAEQIINEVVNGPREEDQSVREQLGQVELTDEQKKEAKVRFSPERITELYRNEVETIGSLFEYEYLKDEQGNDLLVEDPMTGKISKQFVRNSDGSIRFANSVLWDDEIKWDIKRGMETYDGFVSRTGQRTAINEQTIINDSDLKELVGMILSEAIEKEVSDLMIVQYAHFGLVRFSTGPNSWYNHRLLYKSSVDPIVTILKDMVGMKISLESARSPQTNGSIVIGNTNFRAATGASQYGMFMVLRRQGSLFSSLDDLDFPDLVKHEFRRQLRGKDGLIIVGGPVGSGKTTLMTTGLIERLKETNGSINIMSLEKPIETPTPGIVQQDIDDDYDLSWSSAIQAALREMPTILRVGEVNEKDAADAIVRAANSGVVSLTTLHIKSALEVFETLKSYQITENDIKNSLRLVIYLNRVPRLCPHCRIVESIMAHADINRWASTRLNDSRSGELAEVAFRNPEGCKYCREGQNDTSLYGTLGKVGIYELLRVNQPMLRIWRRYKDYDIYVLRDKLLHPDTINFNDEEDAKVMDEQQRSADVENTLSGLMFYSIQRDILAKMQSLDIDYETAQYILNE